LLTGPQMRSVDVENNETFTSNFYPRHRERLKAQVRVLGLKTREPFPSQIQMAVRMLEKSGNREQGTGNGCQRLGLGLTG